MMTFKVVSIAREDVKTGKVRLDAKDGRTIYTNSMFLYVPIDELKNWRIDQELTVGVEETVNA